MMNIRARLALLVMFAALALCWTSSQGYAFENVDVGFHGRIQTTGIMRDITGIQYGLFDSNQWVGWKTELQMDIGVSPVYLTRPPLRIDKVYLSYRGSYDLIYDLESRYDNIPDSGRSWGTGSRYDLGKDDLRSENDMREAFVDVTLDAGENTEKNPVNAHLRLGRQIVMWGEADGFNLVNVVNPQDLRGVTAFANPDDVAMPIWMSRFGLNSGAAGPFNNLSFQFLAIPDNRPTLWAPAGAPYQLGFSQNDHASDFRNMQYGLRLGGLYKDLQAYLYLFNGFENNQPVGGLNLTNYQLDHPRYRMYGASISVPWDAWRAMIRAEASLTDENTYTDISTLSAGGPGYSFHKVFRSYIGIDKPLHPSLGTDSALSTTVQLYYQHVYDWDFENNLTRPGMKEDSYQIILILGTDYNHGTIAPGIFVWYDMEGSYLFSPSVTYSPDGRWSFKLSLTSYLGDKNSASKFAAYIGGNDELAFQVKYQW